MEKSIIEELKEKHKNQIREDLMDGDFGLICSNESNFRDYVDILIENVCSETAEAVARESINLIDCEIDCIKSGNELTPSEQDIAIETCNRIKYRQGTQYKN